MIVLDGKIEDVESAYQIEPDFMDKTNYFYHHSKFGDGQQMARDGFYEYRSALEEMEELKAYDGDSVFLMKARTICQEWIDLAAAKIEQGLAWKRTAEHNLSQWDGLTVDHHFPFLNPENLTDY